jgi:hypothetical protein
MKLDKELERKIRMEVLRYLAKGKPGWDIPHTYNCVRWMRKLMEKEGGNEKILVTAMYLHDIGYPKLKLNYSFKAIMKSKIDHAERGARLARPILEKIGGFSKKEIGEIVELVKNHNKHDKADSFNKKMVMDADGIAMLDWEVVPPTLDKKGFMDFMSKYYGKERSKDRWHTKTGKIYLKKFFRKSFEYWD